MTDKHPDAIRTYVLIGPGNKTEEAIYKDRQDVTILRYDQYPTMEAVAAAIKPPANVILQCHGREDGRFRWQEEGAWDQTRPSYTDLFSKLPRRGIVSIVLGSCYGGIAQRADILASAPPGCQVYSMTGPSTPAMTDTTEKFASETKGLTRPVDLFLEALDNFDPTTYREFEEDWNRKHPTDRVDANPLHALPHMLGLGGKPPLQIDLATEMHGLHGHGNDPALARAIARVQARFDTNYYRNFVDEKGVKHADQTVDGKISDAAEDRLDQSIADMAKRLADGTYTPDPKASPDVQANELKLAYAITAAYLDESGLLQYRIEKQPGYKLPPAPKLDAKGMLITNDAAPPHPYSFNPVRQDGTYHHFNQSPPKDPITWQEQDYIRSVEQKLGNLPDTKEIIGQLRNALSQSTANDTLDHNSALVKQLHQHGISTKSWER